MTQYDITLNVNLLSLAIKVDALVATLPADQKRAYDAEINRTKETKLGIVVSALGLTSQEQEHFRNLFAQLPF